MEVAKEKPEMLLKKSGNMKNCKNLEKFSKNNQKKIGKQ
jgi:hypothetical protein